MSCMHVMNLCIPHPQLRNTTVRRCVYIVYHRCFRSTDVPSNEIVFSFEYCEPPSMYLGINEVFIKLLTLDVLLLNTQPATFAYKRSCAYVYMYVLTLQLV